MYRKRMSVCKNIRKEICIVICIILFIVFRPDIKNLSSKRYDVNRRNTKIFQMFIIQVVHLAFLTQVLSQ